MTAVRFFSAQTSPPTGSGPLHGIGAILRGAAYNLGLDEGAENRL